MKWKNKNIIINTVLFELISVLLGMSLWLKMSGFIQV